MDLLDLPKTGNRFAACSVSCHKREYTLGIGDDHGAGGEGENGAKIHRAGKVVSPAAPKNAATDDLPPGDHFNQTADGRPSRCPWKMECGCRFNDGATTHQD